MGFVVPRRLLAGRWAFTPPFHPYPFRGGLFSVTLSVTICFHKKPPDFHQAYCHMVSGLSSPFCAKAKDSDRPPTGRILSEMRLSGKDKKQSLAINELTQMK